MASRADPGFEIQVIKNGVDTDFFCPQEQAEKLEGDFIFLFAGRFCEQKNIGTLIKAFSVCISRNSDARLVLIGDGPSGNSLKKQADYLGVSKYITWVPWCSKENLRSYYQSSHCFVSPSIIEGMSNAVLEAMACGHPVLCGNCIGNREIIFNGKNGFLFDPLDSFELANRMVMFANNRRYGMRLGIEGRRMCCEEFSWPAVSRKLFSLIKSEVWGENEPI